MKINSLLQQDLREKNQKMRSQENKFAKTLNSYLIILRPFVVEKLELIQNQHSCTPSVLFLFFYWIQ
jgi:hypothetical protein